MNPVQGFINSVVQIPGNIAKTTQQTAQQNHWTLGGFGNNLANGVGQLVGGVVNLVDPFSKTNPVREIIADPNQAAPITSNLIKNFASSVNNTVGQPFNPKTGNLQTPSLSEAENYFYNKPVDVASNALVGAGAVAKVADVAGMAGKAGEVGEAAEGANAAADTAKAGGIPGWQSEGMRVSGQQPLQTIPGTTMQFVPKTPEELAAGKINPVPDNVLATFKNQFTVPTKIAYKMDMDTALKTALSDNAGTNFADLQNTINTITGANGELPQMIHRALDTSNQPVALNQIMQDGLNKIAKVPELRDSPGKLEGFQNIMKELFGQEGKTTDIFGKPTDAPLPASAPLDAWDTMQELERRGHAYLNKSTYLSNNPYYEDLGSAFLDTASNIQDALDAQLKGVDFRQFETPKMREALGNVSPQLLERYDSMPKSIDNLRAFQKPYVDLSTMIKHTTSSANSAWVKASKAISDGIAAAGGGAMGSPLGPIGIGTGALIGKSVLGPILEPIAGSVLQKYGPDLAMAGAKGIAKLGEIGIPHPGLPSMGSLTSGMPLTAAEIAQNNQTPEQQAGATQPNASAPIAEQYPNAKPDQNGNYSLPTNAPTDPNYMTEATFEQNTQGMTPGTPAYNEQLRRFQQSQATAKEYFNGNNKMNFMQNAQDYLQTGQQAKQDLMQLPPGFLNKFKTYADMKKYFSNADNPYAQELADIDQYNTKFESAYANVTGNKPGEDQLLNPTDSPTMIAQKWNRMQQFVVGNYQQNLAPYLALTSFSGQQTSPGNPAPAQYVPQQGPDNAAGMIQGGPLPALNLPQLSLPSVGQ